VCQKSSRIIALLSSSSPFFNIKTSIFDTGIKNFTFYPVKYCTSKITIFEYVNLKILILV
jgi:hypothetical protein